VRIAGALDIAGPPHVQKKPLSVASYDVRVTDETARRASQHPLEEPADRLHPQKPTV